MERTLNHYRKQLDEAEAWAAGQRDGDTIELTTEGATLDMSRRLLDPEVEDDGDDEEEEDRRKTLVKGKGKGKAPRRD